jgi:hypothetical protein
MPHDDFSRSQLNIDDRVALAAWRQLDPDPVRAQVASKEG